MKPKKPGSAKTKPLPRLVSEATAHFEAGKHALAEEALARVTRSDPKNFEAWLYRGLVAWSTAQPALAAEHLARARSIRPGNDAVLSNLSAVQLVLGQADEAEVLGRAAVALNSGNVHAQYNLANALMRTGKLQESEQHYRNALKINPDHFTAMNNLGTLLNDQNRNDEALTLFQRVLELNDRHSLSHNNIGNIWREREEFDKAEACYLQALAIDPNYAEAYSNLGVAKSEQGDYAKAIAYHERAISLKPDLAVIYHNQGDTFRRIGDERNAIAAYRKALQLNLKMVDTHSNLIFMLDLLAGPDTAELQQERRAWNQAHAAHLLRDWEHANVPDPQRLLRIGYVSGDFNMHATCSSFAALLHRFDRTRFEVFAYSNSRKRDALTQALHNAVSCWREITELSDDAAADLIRADGIDILVDLSGYTKGNRLLVFARKPVPVQISAIGYPTGTGMPAMDALISSPVLIPPNERHLYAEEVRYLSTSLGYSRPVSEFPAVNELPALRNGYITFGSFNRLPKITQESLILWAYLLKQLPESRLLLKSGEFDDHQVQEKLMLPFLNAGVAAERVSILGRTSWTEHMRAFNQVDIAIDPVPHGGGITTLESVAMGVPVITMRWPTFAGRASASMLTPLSLTDWIAEGPDHYLEIARQKSQDINALSALRHQLRATFAESVFGNQSAFVSMMENEYRTLWRRWCDRPHAPPIHYPITSVRKP